MASLIAAINHYRPMIAYRATADWQQVAEYIAMRKFTASAVAARSSWC